VAHIQAGGGIVADSTPEGEYDESVNKSKALLSALEIAHRALSGKGAKRKQ
jgi:anthranilate synthase component I